MSNPFIIFLMFVGSETMSPFSFPVLEICVSFLLITLQLFFFPKHGWPGEKIKVIITNSDSTTSLPVLWAPT